MPDADPVPTEVLTPAGEHPPGQALGDEEIYCPLCNYNLTGVHSGRCPECGSDFHREALFTAQRANQITLIPWDDPEPASFFDRLRQTLRVCLFDPRRFAFAFSVQPQDTRASRFALITLLPAWLSFAAPAALGALLARKFPQSVLVDDVAEQFGIGLLSASLVIIAQGLIIAISACILWVFCPHYDGRPHLRPWLAICAYASSHLLLTPVIIPIFLLFATWPGAEGELLLTHAVAMSVVILGCGLLTACTLRGVVELRCPAASGGKIAIALLVLLHAAMGLIGTAVCMGLAAAIWEAF